MKVTWDHEPRATDNCTQSNAAHCITALAPGTGNHERHADINYATVTLMSHTGESDEDENRQRGAT
jgi:hypothetical protein